MKRFLGRWIVAAALAFTLAAAPQVAQAAPNEQLATVEQLKTEALRALKEGEFNRTSQLMTQAASLSDDPSLVRMNDWIRQFESQRQGLVSERRKQYDKAVADVHKLLGEGYAHYALDRAKDAYLLADDKEAFAEEKWVVDLMRKAVALADEYEANEQWFKALGLYSDLGAIEPANPQWKERLKLATRRIRLIALYNPDLLKEIQKAELDARQKAVALLDDGSSEGKATTRPTFDDNDAFRIDWRDTLRDIRMEMLREALADARSNYWRDVSYRNLLVGGLSGLRTLVTTPGLENAFPNLADAEKARAFLATVDDALEAAHPAAATNDHFLLNTTLARLKLANKQTIDLPEGVLVSEFADGAFGELDPFTSMIWPADLEEFNKSTQGEFGGVGIQIQSDDDGSLRVVSPIENSPAFRAGIKAYDIITGINGKNAKGISLNQAVKNIAGTPGTTVTLTVMSPNGTVKEYTIRREIIKVESIKGYIHLPGGGWDFFIDQQEKVAYIRLTNFTKTTSEELDKALAALREQGAKGLILDLRYNPGGLLTAATDVADKFLREGVIVSTKADRDLPVSPPIKAESSTGDVTLPLVVLVNQYSASASEIVSGALKDLSRATIVGERTFGKGSVQMLFPIDRDLTGKAKSYLKLTTSHYYLPSGRCIHREENSTEWGVDPDLKVEMTPEETRVAIQARQELDILREAHSAPAEGEQRKLRDVAEGVEDAVREAQQKAAEASDEKKPPDLLACDPQLSAALLLLRLQLAGAAL
jgi:carboxyl-terminal processing protease